jgi:hypothetical protein
MDPRERVTCELHLLKLGLLRFPRESVFLFNSVIGSARFLLIRLLVVYQKPEEEKENFDWFFIVCWLTCVG